MSSTLPFYPYKKYPHDTLNTAHYADQFVPLIAMIYILLLFVLYCHQYVTRSSLWFTPCTTPLHRMGIVSLFILFVYASVNYLLSNNYYLNLPFDCCCCADYIRLLFITFVFVKYGLIYCIIFNLSYINQNPFVNPRYRYISKRARIRLRRFFNILYLIVGILFMIQIYGAWLHAASDQYTKNPHHFSYCTQTFTVYTFMFSFAGDALGVLLYSCLFGRNACEMCRRSIKPHHGHPHEDGNQSDVASYAYGHHTIKYDLDDPIQSKLGPENIINRKYSINKIEAFKLPAQANVDALLLTGNDMDERNDNDFMVKMNKDKVTLKKLKQAPLIKTREILFDEEWRGIAEQKRVLRLIWIMIIAYWTSVLLFITFGLLESVSCFTMMISATCIVLFNDYEFGSTYWQYRRCVCGIGSYLCCVCRRTYCCNECFCGDEKLHTDHFNAIGGYKPSAIGHNNATNEANKFVRL
eukprot:264058_1